MARGSMYNEPTDNTNQLTAKANFFLKVYRPITVSQFGVNCASKVYFPGRMFGVRPRLMAQAIQATP